jgi:hypothetical protein
MYDGSLGYPPWYETQGDEGNEDDGNRSKPKQRDLFHASLSLPRAAASLSYHNAGCQ